MARYHLISGGAGSWLAAKVDMAAYPNEEHRFTFADTLYEDADCYRFLIEGLANLLNRKVMAPQASEFPDYRVSADVSIADYQGNAGWRSFLAGIREQAVHDFPELTWLVEGRDPWELFRDRHFLANNRIDICSEELKRDVIDRWRKANCEKTDIFCIGIGPHEAHRYHRLAAFMNAKGWSYEAPLLGTMEGEFGPFGYLHDAKIERPRLYRLGYMHNNCGGFCVKAGHAHYLNRLRQQPERFAYDAMMERKLGEFIGKPVSMLTDRRGDGKKKLMTLDKFAAGVGAETQFDYQPGDSGCGCMLDDAS